MTPVLLKLSVMRLSAYQRRMEPMTDYRSVQTVSELTVWKTLMASAKQKYLECLRVPKVTN